MAGLASDLPRPFNVIGMLRLKSSFARGVLLVLIVACFSSCALFRSRRNKNPQPGIPHRVGTVTLVNTALGFALVDVGSLYSPAPGTALKTFRAGAETAVLAVSPERRRPFVAADIVSGAPQRGDEVYE
jgi:hypothetical protein